VIYKKISGRFCCILLILVYCKYKLQTEKKTIKCISAQVKNVWFNRLLNILSTLRFQQLMYKFEFSDDTKVEQDRQVLLKAK